jgi:thymidylate synthase
MLASLKSDQEEMIATLQDSFKSEISALQIKVKEDIRLENQKLIKKFEIGHQSLRHELTQKLSSETDKFSHLLKQVQDDTESELVAVKNNFQVMSTEFDAKLGQQAKDTSLTANELTGKILQNREQVTDQIAKLSEEINTVKNNFANDEEVFQKRQGERLEQLTQAVEKGKSVNKRNFDQLNSAINNLKDKLPVRRAAACSFETPQPSERSFVPDTLALNANDSIGSNNENCSLVCSCNLESCNVCMNGGVSDQNVPMSVRPYNANSFLSPSDFSLPIFDDSSKVNAKFHLNQLDEFMRLRGVPKQFQLAIACKSVVDPVGKQWLAAISQTLTNYEQFKIAFAKNYWSQSHQNLVMCSIYQDKYDRQSNLSMSGHFINYAVLASYLELKLGDGELIDAIRYHFLSYAQRTMLGANIGTIQEAIDFLKRLEMMEGNDTNRKPNPSHNNSNPLPDNRPQHGKWNDRYRRNEPFVRQVRYDHRNNYRRNNNDRGSGHYRWYDSFEN